MASDLSQHPSRRLRAMIALAVMALVLSAAGVTAVLARSAGSGGREPGGVRDAPATEQARPQVPTPTPPPTTPAVPSLPHVPAERRR